MKILILTLAFGIFSGSISADEKKQQKSVTIPCTTWFQGFVHMADAVVMGKITEVTEAVSDIDSQSKVYRYSLAVSAVGGNCPELKGVSEVRSENHNATKVGEWVIMLVHYYENKPDLATGSRPLLTIVGPDDPLAKLFATKGPDYLSYTEDDMQLLKDRMPDAYENMLPRRQWHFKQTTKSEQDKGGQPSTGPESKRSSLLEP